jgi:predicted ArsR family transcriptional regulator
MQTWKSRFFESTRGRVLKLLSGTARTVKELARHLHLTDNAVRAHLASLERDGLVLQSGVRPGTRKPNFAYDLTAAGDQFFPKAHGAVLAGLIDVLDGALKEGEVERFIREVAARLVDKELPGIANLAPEKRIARFLEAVEKTGAISDVQRLENGVVVRGCSCPLSEVVVNHPELCQVAAKVLSEVLGQQVKEQCQRNGLPRCCFQISPA